MPNPRSRTRVALAAGLLAAQLAIASTASAQQARRPQSLAISISGGGSLGAYEAGYLFHLEQTIRTRPDLLRLRIATGTSAGSMNALLMLMSSCLPSPTSPEQSVFYSTWTRSTFENLYIPDDVTTLGMFSRNELFTIWSEQEVVYERDLDPDCDVVLGVPTTRVDAFTVHLPGSIEGLPRSEETFVMRIRGREGGGPPRVDNYVDRARAIAPAYLPVDGDEPHEIRFVRDVAFASAAFPIAFSPSEVAMCVGGETCHPDGALAVSFVDGGVLDNTPLRLASTIARTGLQQDAATNEPARFRDHPDTSLRDFPVDTHFMLVDPDVTLYPPKPETPASMGGGAFEVYLNAASHVIDSARSRELSMLFENYPDIVPHLGVSHLYLPPTATYMDGFFGLFDEQFLAFDFALGMVDAHREFEVTVRRPLMASLGEDIAFEEPARAPGSRTDAAAACIRAFLDESADAVELCDGRELASTRALLQLAIERLYAHCRSLPAGTRTGHRHCVRAMAGEDVPVVPHVSAAKVRAHRIEDDESVREAIDYLDALGFVFHGLDLGPGQGDRALLAIRRRLASIGGRFIDEQPAARQLLDAALRYVENEIAYTPPRVIGHLVAGRHLELGVSIGGPYSRVRWLRATAGVSIVGFETLISSDSIRMAFGASAGIELEPIGLSGSLLQLRAGARFGYSIGTLDRAGQRSCPSTSDARFCSRPYVDTYIAAALLEIVRLQISAHFYPAWGQDRGFGFFVGPSIGVELRTSE